MQVFMAHGMVAKGMIHGPQDLRLPVKVNQTDNLLELIEGVKLRFGQGFDIAASRLSQSQKGIPVLKVSGLRFAGQ